MAVNNSVQGGSNLGLAKGDTPAPPVSAQGDEVSNMFMTLLVAQIKNQDPLEPGDPAQFVNQLTQMSQMQAVQQQTAQGKANAALLENLQTMELGRQVGSRVLVESKEIQLSATPGQGRILLEDPASVRLHLTADDGRQIDVALGQKPAGPLEVTLDAAKMGLAPGHYRIQVLADGKPGPAFEVAGVIESVRVPLTGGVPLIKVSGIGEVPFNQISQFNGAANKGLA